MKRDKVSIRILLLFCLYMYPVMFKSSNILSYVYIYGIPFLFLCTHLNGVLKLSLKQLKILALSIVLVLLCIIYPTIHGTGDLSYIRVATYVFRKLVIYLFLISILGKKYKDDLCMEQFMKYFAFAQAIYVIGTIIFVLIPPIKNTWFTLFAEVIESEEALKSYGYTFRIGWQGFSGYSHTIDSTFACIFALFLFYCTDSEKQIRPLQFWLTYILSFIGNMFYGRSGLVVTIVASLIAVFVWNRRNFTRVAKYVALITFGFIVLMNLKDMSLFSDWFYWMSNPIKNLLTTGSFNNASIRATSADIVFPGMSTFLFGDGFFTVNDRYYMRTDSGIMRNLYFWGVLGTSIAYGVTISSISMVKRKDTMLFILMLLSFVAFEYKGVVYYDFLALFFALSFCDNLRIKYVNNGMNVFNDTIDLENNSGE